jgi:hypothetical protein
LMPEKEEKKDDEDVERWVEEILIWFFQQKYPPNIFLRYMSQSG